MRLSEEYKRQSIWRDWPPLIKTFSIDKHNTLTDLGCGIGTVTAYFPDLNPLLNNWLNLLKSDGWIAIVEMKVLAKNKNKGSLEIKRFKMPNAPYSDR